MDIRKARVEAHHLIVDVGGKNIGPGQPVDLDEEFAPGVRVRDVFPEDYFEAPSDNRAERQHLKPRGGRAPQADTAGEEKD